MQAGEASNPLSTTNLSGGPTFDPLEMARVILAFGDCSKEMQGVALKMSAAVADPELSDQQRAQASDAMIRSLFPGTAEDVLAAYRAMARVPERKAAVPLVDKQFSFADRLAAEMQKKGVTQEGLAAAAGIGLPSVANILSGRYRPQMTTVARFAEALNVAPELLWPGFEPG
jgi:lambda repressor-like predicted transcriptional regulator